MHARTIAAAAGLVAVMGAGSGCSLLAEQQEGAPTKSSAAGRATGSPVAVPRPALVVSDVQVDGALLAGGDVGADYEVHGGESVAGTVLVADPRKVLVCDRSHVVIPGEPEVSRRVMTRAGAAVGGFFQHVAVYPTNGEASSALEAVTGKAKQCAPTGEIGGNGSTPPERTQWTVNATPTSADVHLQAVHRGQYPEDSTPTPVNWLVVDYSVAGNALVTTLLIDWTKPGAPAESIAERATKLHGVLLSRLEAGSQR